MAQILGACHTLRVCRRASAAHPARTRLPSTSVNEAAASLPGDPSKSYQGAATKRRKRASVTQEVSNTSLPIVLGPRAAHRGGWSAHSHASLSASTGYPSELLPTPAKVRGGVQAV